MREKYDYNRLKSEDAEDYTRYEYDQIKTLCQQYMGKLSSLNKERNRSRMSTEEYTMHKKTITDDLELKCYCICPNEETLCNILLDVCYKINKYKHIPWDIAGQQIIKNLLKKHNNQISYPAQDPEGDFEYGHVKYSMKTIEVALDDHCE